MKKYLSIQNTPIGYDDASLDNILLALFSLGFATMPLHYLHGILILFAIFPVFSTSLGSRTSIKSTASFSIRVRRSSNDTSILGRFGAEVASLVTAASLVGEDLLW